MIDPKFLEYYNQELIYMRESAGEFSNTHPKIAKRFGMTGTTIDDPYVERLIEAFSFVSARMRIKLDAQHPLFTQHLLDVVYPNYVSPTPSMAVAKIHPDFLEGDLKKGFKFARNSTVVAQIPQGEKTPCTFTTGKEVTLWPFDIVDAKLSGVPPDIPNLQRHFPPHLRPAGCLRLRLRMQDESLFSELIGLDSLSVYLSDDEKIASHLYELLHTSAVAVFVGEPNKLSEFAYPITESALVVEGLDPDDNLLPLGVNNFQGHQLVHEFFACPSRFYFFKLQHLAQVFSTLDSNEAEIAIILTRDTTHLRGSVEAKNFSLFCTPIINLFEQHIDKLEIEPNQQEFQVVADKERPQDVEVYSINKMFMQEDDAIDEIDFQPLYQALNQDEDRFNRYFSV